MSENKITQLFGIKYPLIQAGMIWCSGYKLAAAVSNAGGLGIIGSGSCIRMFWMNIFKNVKKQPISHSQSICP
jgi:NAD(P)H-dependent flavin oxidoreductase YrpB (nitropropane dioxygenase family)